MDDYQSLTHLGWRPFFQQQLTLEELEACHPARIVEQHRSRVVVATATGVQEVLLQHSMPAMVVGDWLLLDNDGQFVRLLERSTCFRRKAAGEKVDWQLISANVDTALIVSALNEDFNLNRIERFLALVNEAGAEPVVVLSKADLATDPQDAIDQVANLGNHSIVLAINCLNADSVAQLDSWLRAGETLVVLGSSGVGKSTLINSLLGEQRQQTGRIREDDGKGRHTTTSRSLIAITRDTDHGPAARGLILDTPGMRELQLADARDGIAATFADIESLAERCRYGDCQHQSEPGCAVRDAVEKGELDQRRLDNYFKLRREEALNSASLSQKRADDRALGKFYKRTLAESHKLKGR